MRACRRHPKERAGWNCATCKMDLCPDCVAKQPGGPKGRQIPVCCACGRGVATITVHRRQYEPFSRRMWGAFGFPLGSTGIISLLFVGFVRALTSYTGASMMGAGAFVLRQGLFWAFVFFIIRSIANNEKRMGVFGFTDLHADIISPAIKGAFSTAILWIPAAVYIYLAADDGLMGLLSYPVREDPAVWMLALMGAFYAPMALLAAATDLSFAYLLNPIFIGQAIWRIGRDYLVAVLAIAAVMLIGTGLSALLGLLVGLIPIPFVGRWLSFTVGLYAPFVSAGFLGHLLFLHGEVLDWGRGEDYQVALLAGIEPRGQVRPKPRADDEPAPPWSPVSIPVLKPGPTQVDEPSVPRVPVQPNLVSLLNLSSSLVSESQFPDPPAEASLFPAASDVPLAPASPPPAETDKPPSLLRFGIVMPSGILEAQAFYEEGSPAPVDLPPGKPSVPSLPAPPAEGQTAPDAPASATVVQHQSPHLPGAAAPTMLGFRPALPDAATAATRIGHQAVRADAPPTKKG